MCLSIYASYAISLEKIVTTLRTGAEYAGLPVHHCVLIAGSQSGVVGAENIGMPCVVLRSRCLPNCIALFLYIFFHAHDMHFPLFSSIGVQHLRVAWSW